MIHVWVDVLLFIFLLLLALETKESKPWIHLAQSVGSPSRPTKEHRAYSSRGGGYKWDFYIMDEKAKFRKEYYRAGWISFVLGPAK